MVYSLLNWSKYFSFKSNKSEKEASYETGKNWEDVFPPLISKFNTLSYSGYIMGTNGFNSINIIIAVITRSVNRTICERNFLKVI